MHVPPYCLCTKSDDDVVPFCGGIAFGEAQNGGGEIP